MATMPEENADDRPDAEVAGGEGKPLPYQWPGAPLLLAGFCAVASLLTIGGYIRTLMMVKDSARQTNKALEEIRAVWRLELERLHERLALAEARLAVVANRQRAGSGQGSSGATPDFGALPEVAADAGALPPLPPKAEPLPAAAGNETGAKWMAEVVSFNPGQKRVLVNRGRWDGLEDGKPLSVYRGETWIGDLRVVKAYDDMAACQIESSSGREFMNGDLARIPAAP